MNKLLGQIAVAFGGVLFIAVLIMTLSSGMPILNSTFRAFVVMSVSSIVLAAFFRFFTSQVYRFITEQVVLRAETPSRGALTEDNAFQESPDNALSDNDNN